MRRLERVVASMQIDNPDPVLEKGVVLYGLDDHFRRSQGVVFDEATELRLNPEDPLLHSYLRLDSSYPI